MIKKHLEIDIPSNCRIIVISDIHGHLERFISLLDKVNYTDKDYLVILGDFVEKGDQILDTIHYIAQLDLNERVYVLAGNCEWAIGEMLTNPSWASHISNYLKRTSYSSIIRETIHSLGYDYHNVDCLKVQKDLYNKLEKEVSYFTNLLTSLRINNYLFVHAGIENRKDYLNSDLHEMLTMQHFLDLGHQVAETVVVGHLPTSNYHHGKINNDIIIDKDKKIICIDGGTGVKSISQLNALIIQNDNYQCVKVQPLPSYHTVEDIKGIERPINKISFPIFEIEIIKRGNQFSKCKQLGTNTILDINNHFIYNKDNHYYCLDDYTDNFLTIKKDEKVKVIGIYDEYAYVIYRGITGWVLTTQIDYIS